jgi:hypothetical protein
MDAQIHKVEESIRSEIKITQHLLKWCRPDIEQTATDQAN